MPAVLSDKRICHRTVPLAWKPVLDELALFQQREKQLRANVDDQSLTDELHDLHGRLMEASATLLEPHALDHLDELDIQRVFVKSVFLLTQIANSVAGDDSVLDTAGSRSLHLYEADFLSDARNLADLRASLTQACPLDDSEILQIEAEVSQQVKSASRKQEIVRALRSYFHLWEDDPRLRSGMFEFFSTLYPDVGIVEDEVDLIITGTMIFFCLPFAKDGLTTERFENLTEDAQRPIRKFLSRVNRFSQWQFAHFPVFGFRKGEDLSRDLLSELSNLCGIDATELAGELSTLTAIVPLQDIDKYVAHDLWGHSWQASMLHFDQMYQEIATYADPLSLEEEASGTDDQRLRFGDCFLGTGEQLVLNETNFHRFVDLEVSERLPVAMTPVLAEVLADVAEFKPMATNQVENLPTSSVFKNFPAKLDLTMQDVRYYFRQATKAFRLWASRSDRQRTTIDQLVSRGASPEAAQQAVRRAAEIWKALEEDWFSPEMIYVENEASLNVNVICRLALNFLGIHRETLLSYKRIANLKTGRLPLKGFRDLMLIAVAVFFELSRSRNLWRVDEFLSLRIEPLCEQLAGRD